MTYKYLSLLFFCIACVSAFGQELQSPQINQNAIFANPGLAGSKGQTRIATTLNLATDNYRSRWSTNNNVLDNETYLYNKFYSGMVSVDGLLLKDKLGIGGYLKNEYYQRTYEYLFYNNGSSSPSSKEVDHFNYSNVYVGFMLAPKFNMHSKNIEKKGMTLSPALSVGFKGTAFNYSGIGIYTLNNDTIYKDGSRSRSMALDYLSLGLLYTNPKSFIGIKFNFNSYKSSLFLYDISLVVARSYFNKNVERPKFSFNPQFYFAFPIYELNNHHPYRKYFDRQNFHNLSSFMCINLDFRYKKILFGTFANVTMYNYVYAGITGGIQLSNTKIVINYSPKLSPKAYTTHGLFISANFYIKPKKAMYQ